MNNLKVRRARNGTEIEVHMISIMTKNPNLDLLGNKEVTRFGMEYYRGLRALMQVKGWTVKQLACNLNLMVVVNDKDVAVTEFPDEFIPELLGKGGRK